MQQTIEAVREAFPEARIWAVFEPRSNTSRRKVFQDDYIKAFKCADRVIFKNVTARTIDAESDRIDVSLLSAAVTASGVSSVCLDDVGAIRAQLWSEIKVDSTQTQPLDVICVMSNGSFDGLNDLLQADLAGA